VGGSAKARAYIEPDSPSRTVARIAALIHDSGDAISPIKAKDADG